MPSAVAKASAILTHAVLRAVARAHSGGTVSAAPPFVAVAVQRNVAYSVSSTALRASSLAAVLADVLVVTLAQTIHTGSMIRAFVRACTALACNTGPSSLALALQIYARSLAGALVWAAVGSHGTGGGALGLVTGRSSPALIALAAVVAATLSMPTASTGALFNTAIFTSVTDVAFARALARFFILFATPVEAALVGAQGDGAVLSFELLVAVTRAVFLAIAVSTAIVHAALLVTGNAHPFLSLKGRSVLDEVALAHLVHTDTLLVALVRAVFLFAALAAVTLVTLALAPSLAQSME